MFITIINDCRDANAAGRQASRASSLFGFPATFIGVGNDLEAAGNLIDVLDAGEGREGIILVNVAPRHGQAKKWPNGSPFGYFWYQKTLIIASIDRFTLSLAKKLRVTDEVEILDLAEVVDVMIQKHFLPDHLRDTIVNSQFRSYEFLPRLAQLLLMGKRIPSQNYSMEKILDAPKAIWLVDNFGNCKTTLLPEDIAFGVGKTISTKEGVFPTYARLKDVPDGKTAMVIGSSGLEEKRFLEIVIQGVSAAEHFGLSSGTIIF